MKHLLEFDLPSEEPALKHAMNGKSYFIAIQDMKDWFEEQLYYNPNETHTIQEKDALSLAYSQFKTFTDGFMDEFSEEYIDNETDADDLPFDDI